MEILVVIALFRLLDGSVGEPQTRHLERQTMKLRFLATPKPSLKEHAILTLNLHSFATFDKSSKTEKNYVLKNEEKKPFSIYYQNLLQNWITQNRLIGYQKPSLKSA